MQNVNPFIQPLDVFWLLLCTGAGTSTTSGGRKEMLKTVSKEEFPSESQSAASQGLASQGPSPTAPGEASRAGLGAAAVFNQEPRSSEMFVVTRELQAQERKSIHRSGSGMVRTTRVRDHPTIRRQT